MNEHAKAAQGKGGASGTSSAQKDYCYNKFGCPYNAKQQNLAAQRTEASSGAVQLPSTEK